MLADRIELYPHNPGWKALAEIEARRLKVVFGDQALLIEHTGSTAIPGIKAKPIIDLLVVVKDIQAVDGFNPAMTDLGYLPLGEYGIPGRRFFMGMDGDRRTRNVHAFQAGHTEIARMIDFRDYLRAHPDEARVYEQLKEDLARRYLHDVRGYAAAKGEYIESVVQKSRNNRAAQEPPAGDP